MAKKTKSRYPELGVDPVFDQQVSDYRSDMQKLNPAAPDRITMEIARSYYIVACEQNRAAEAKHGY